ncbi:vWA domain-containing protein [Salipiger sp. PrR003]|uniref:vWA domain-containing protein n=1 Tax=Salipiger sp. PrR003 TaxID=2706776 RepID=UPI0013D94E43|nr:vWA domain-containing protein [Salipiger sp. PrR003]NDV50372.1 VWA domain-containing protein [Salipiger sp. PrR003]
MTKTKADDQKTFVTLLLDRSYSMMDRRTDTVEGVNAYIAGLKQAPGKYRFTLLQFDSVGSLNADKMEIAPIIEAAKIKDVDLITDEQFTPRGGTPLIDATVTTIKSIEEAVAGRDVKVVLAVQTDGDENTSKQYTWSYLKELLAAKVAQGWQIVFLGADINAYQQGASMGLSASKTMSYSGKEGTRAAFAETARSTIAFACGDVSEMNYSVAAKLSAGDAYLSDAEKSSA